MGEGWKCTACGTKAVLQRNPDGTIWRDDAGEAWFRCPKCTDVEEAMNKPGWRNETNAGLIEQLLRAEREACAADVCGYCEAGVPLMGSRTDSSFWQHMSVTTGSVPCLAAAIRERGWREAEARK